MYASSCNKARGRRKIFELRSIWRFPKKSSRYLPLLYIYLHIYLFAQLFAHLFIHLLSYSITH
jgi:hypothetical protein